MNLEEHIKQIRTTENIEILKFLLKQLFDKYDVMLDNSFINETSRPIYAPRRKEVYIMNNGGERSYLKECVFNIYEKPLIFKP